MNRPSINRSGTNAIPVKWSRQKERFYPNESNPDFVLVPITEWTRARVRKNPNTQSESMEERRRVGF